jgi:cytochrome c oxidase subunit I
MTARLRAPGFPRAGLAVILGIAFSAALTWIVRVATGHATFTHYLSGDAITTVSLIACPLFFLVGLGAFDYWFYWAAGRPTRPEDHSSHGAHSWRDYFRVNTDHKVIGV